MAKTNAELTEENKQLKIDAAEQEQENADLKEELGLTKQAEVELTIKINDMEDKDFSIVDGAIYGTKIKVLTPDQYREHSAKSGLIMGRHPKQVMAMTIEDLRAKINSKWTPKMIMEQSGMDVEAFKQLVWKLSKSELRDKPIRFSITANTIERG